MKQILFVQSQAPHGSVAGQEGLDALLAGSAFTTCRVLLLEDAVFQLVKGQETSTLGVKDYSVSYGALADYGVEDIFVAESDLEARGLEINDLLLTVKPLGNTQVRELLADADVILSF